MRRFIDVNPYDWFFRDITELLDAESGFFVGIPYNTFAENSPAIDISYVNTVLGTGIVIHTVVGKNDDNPITVLVDGAEVEHGDPVMNTPSAGYTSFELYRLVAVGSSVRVKAPGIPLMTSGTDRPAGVSGVNLEYPHAQLVADGDYYFDPMYGKTTELVYINGKQLKRVIYDAAKISNWTLFGEEDEYTISPSKVIYVNFNMRNDTIELQFHTSIGGIIVPNYRSGVLLEAQNIKYFNRFFPNTKMYRLEVLTSLNKLRMIMEEKFTDGSAFRSTKTSSRFIDVDALLGGTPPWWWEHVRDLEEVVLSDGSYLLTGYPDGNLYPSAAVTRAHLVVLMEKFSHWMVDCLK
jgi:hypothetical protein